MNLIIKPSAEAFNKANSIIKILDQTKTYAGSNNLPVSRLAKKINTVKVPVSRYFESPQQISYSYSDSEYDLTSVFKLLKYEAYFLKAVQKKTSLLIKSGLSLACDNDEIKKYIDNRFKYMHLQTGVSLDTIIKKLGYYLVICSNAFLIKVRDKNCQFAQSYIKNGKEMNPVVGLFTAHPACMKPKYKYVKDKSQKTGGRLELDKWVFVNFRGVVKEFDPDDVVHFTLYKEDGMLFGMPEIIPAIDDIRTLRKIEEDIQLLIYRDLFPIIHYKVEDPAVVDHRSGETELDRARNDMQNIIQDGGIATDARHSLDFVGNQGKSLDANPYLKYFQERVFTGLGVSAVDLGLGETASRSTAETLSGQLIDFVKFVQQEVSQQFGENVLDEMMLQSFFDGVFEQENAVSLVFQEIDIEWQIRQENHQADLFAKGVSTIHETRNKMGKKTISDDEIDTTTYPGIQNRLNIREIEKKEAQSAADRDSVKSAKSNSNIVKAKDSLELLDSHGTLSLQDEFKNAILSIKDNTNAAKKINIMFATKGAYDKIKENMITNIKNGVYQAIKDSKLESYNMPIVEHNIFKPLDDLRDSVVDMLYKDINTLNRAATRISTAFNTESTRAYNYGYASFCVSNNKNNLKIYTDFDNISSDSVEYIGKEITVNNQKILSEIPPYRPNSRLKVRINDSIKEENKEELEEKNQNIDIDNKIAELKDFIEEKTSNISKKDINEDITKLYDLIVTLIKNNKDENTSLMEKLIDIVDQNREKENNNIKTIVDSIPKNITVNTPPMEINIKNTPLDINIESQPVEIKLPEEKKQESKKKINVIRNEHGQIISASIEED